MEDDKELEKISNKLSLIASLLMDLNEHLGQKMSVKEKVSYLVSRGITNDEDISTILNITRSHAKKEKSLLKRGAKHGREKAV